MQAHILTIFAALFLFIAPNVSSDSRTHEYSLDNGLKLIVKTDNRAPVAVVQVWYKVGGSYEYDGITGISHALEHMMFKGTRRRSAEDVNRELDELGGQSNAYTTEEQTVYYATVLPKFQDRIVDLLTDMMSPVLDESEFETERKVILEEIAKYEDQPPFGGFERAMEVHFSPRGLGRRVLGTSESIEAMTAQRMRDYFCQRYRPENIVVAATGNVDFEGLVDEVQKRTTDWGERTVTQSLGEDDPKTLPEGIDLSTRVQTPDAMQAYSIQIGEGPSSACGQRHAARLLATILGDEGGSRYFWDLIDTGRAEVATCWPQEFSDTGAWFTYLVCVPEDLQANRDHMRRITADVAEKGVKADELSQVINKTVAAYIMQSERPSSRLFSVGGRFLMQGEYLDLDRSLETIRAIDQQAIADVAKKYLTKDPVEILAVAK